MKRYLTVLSVAAVFVLCTVPTGTSQTPASARDQMFAGKIQPYLKKYCFACHNAQVKTGGLNVLALNTVASLDAAGGDWERVLRKIKNGEMPPTGAPKPTTQDTHVIAAWLEHELDQLAAVKPDPGRVAIHRLNRAEYNNAVRDLLAVDFTPADDFPADDAGYGFDNIADVLSLPPVLMEKYLSAATKVTRQALGLVKVEPALERFTIERRLPQGDRFSEDFAFGSRGGATVRHRFPFDAEYLIRARMRGEHPKALAPMLDFRVDGRRVHLVEARISEQEEDEGRRSFEVRTRIPAGTHEVTVTFLRDTGLEEEGAILRDNRGLPVRKMLAVDYIEIGGPFNPTGPGQTPARKQILTCTPGGLAEEEPCARQILSRLARLAYRRPVTETDVQNLMRFYHAGREDFGHFEGGVQVALKAMLVSPHFLFRLERDPAAAAPGSIHAVRDLDLASRLSFFLWSSLPDDELLRVAEANRLHDPAVLAAQVKRMLADPKSSGLVNNFAGQWLQLRNLALVKPDPEKFPEFDTELRQSARRETELFFQSVLRENRSVLDFLNANYTFLNEPLAKHYGIPGVKGRHFRRVALDGEKRGGLLTQASVLTVSSYPTRTSPVIRGKWILENILGSPPPPPPPNVPELKDGEIGKSASLRQQLEQHRANPACAACHNKMDPLGFALENYDAVGKWRDRDGSFPIDASGSLPSGVTFASARDLKAALLTEKQQFVECLAEKMLTYAVGRGLERFDKPVVRAIARQIAAEEYRFQALVLGIVNSQPFRMRKVPETALVQKAGKMSDNAGRGAVALVGQGANR
jgi:hypothetical protein